MLLPPTYTQPDFPSQHGQANIHRRVYCSLRLKTKKLGYPLYVPFTSSVNDTAIWVLVSSTKPRPNKPETINLFFLDTDRFLNQPAAESPINETNGCL